uniref:Uncharacterized protein n=1 Tax=Tanacetum cinerariifolium TaxID=118510 RepID=A0A6L2NX88_TANCI|nr:hypothetical protein [Tanacetum cinerariifolium]
MIVYVATVFIFIVRNGVRVPSWWGTLAKLAAMTDISSKWTEISNCGSCFAKVESGMYLGEASRPDSCLPP